MLTLALVASGAAAHPGDGRDWHPGDCKPGRMLYLYEPDVRVYDRDEGRWVWQYPEWASSVWVNLDHLRMVWEPRDGSGGVRLQIVTVEVREEYDVEDREYGREVFVFSRSYWLRNANITGVLHRIECQHRPR